MFSIPKRDQAKSREPGVASTSDQHATTRPRLHARIVRVLRTAAGMIRGQGKDLAVRIEVGLRRPRHGQVNPASGCNVLIVDAGVPDPLFGFGFPRMFEVVQSLLRAGHRVSVYPIQATPQELERMDQLCSGRVRFHLGEGPRGLRRLLWKEGAGFDMIFISRPEPMDAFNRVVEKWPRARGLVVYDLEAVVTPREARRRVLFDRPWTPEEETRALEAEIALARRADAVVAVTEADKAMVGALLALPSFVLSFPVPIQDSNPGFADRQDLLFVGRMTGQATHYPNVDAVQWFVRDVMPQLDAQIGTGYRVHLVGLFDPEAGMLASDRVILHGAIDDLAPFYEQCRVFIAPTRYAAGVPIKVVETIGKGLPCVTTALLAQQLGAEGHGFAPDSSAETFAGTCALLYADEAAWHRARDYGLSLAQARFSQQAFDATLQDLVGTAMRRSDPAADVAARDCGADDVGAGQR
jgi:glycosyltransferase involved in cell wall biosynthesis